MRKTALVILALVLSINARAAKKPSDQCNDTLSAPVSAVKTLLARQRFSDAQLDALVQRLRDLVARTVGSQELVDLLDDTEVSYRVRKKFPIEAQESLLIEYLRKNENRDLAYQNLHLLWSLLLFKLGNSERDENFWQFLLTLAQESPDRLGNLLARAWNNELDRGGPFHVKVTALKNALLRSAKSTLGMVADDIDESESDRIGAGRNRYLKALRAELDRPVEGTSLNDLLDIQMFDESELAADNPGYQHDADLIGEREPLKAIVFHVRAWRVLSRLFSLSAPHPDLIVETEDPWAQWIQRHVAPAPVFGGPPRVIVDHSPQMQKVEIERLIPSDEIARMYLALANGQCGFFPGVFDRILKIPTALQIRAEATSARIVIRIMNPPGTEVPVVKTPPAVLAPGAGAHLMIEMTNPAQVQLAHPTERKLSQMLGGVFGGNSERAISDRFVVENVFPRMQLYRVLREGAVRFPGSQLMAMNRVSSWEVPVPPENPFVSRTLLWIDLRG